jgi:hypothetical protein
MSPLLIFLLVILVVFAAVGLTLRAQWRKIGNGLREAALRASAAAAQAAEQAKGPGHGHEQADERSATQGTSSPATTQGTAQATDTGGPATPSASAATPETSPPRSAPAPETPDAPYTLDPALLALALSGGSTQRGGKTIGFAAYDIGLLEITTGRVAASDPLVSPDPPAFTQAVPSGRHPVRVFAARFGDDERIAYALLRFSDAPAVRWENARTGAQYDKDSGAPLGAGEFFGYGVDSGTGCFMDPHAGQLLNARMEEEDDYFETIIDEMEKTYVHTRSWADIRPAPAAPENVICFSSGWGDGSYPSFFGFDEEGKVAMLVTDFLVVGEE